MLCLYMKKLFVEILDNFRFGRLYEEDINYLQARIC